MPLSVGLFKNIFEHIIVKHNYINKTFNCLILQEASIIYFLIVSEGGSHNDWERVCAEVGVKAWGNGESSTVLAVS